MALHDFEWFLQHAPAYESLSLDQVNALARGEQVEYGETAPDAQATEPAAVSAEPAPAAKAADSSATPAAAKTEPAEPVVLAKDGSHTIPFSELEAARARGDALEAALKAKDELLDSLKGAKKDDAGTGGTVAQEDVLADFKKQYPEIAELLAPALQKIVDAGVDARVATMRKELDAAITPLQQSAQDTQVDYHFQTITDAVPDFETLRDSGKVEEWIKTQPSYIRNAAETVLKEGTASEVIELFNQYKATLAKPAEPAAPSKAELEAAAKKAIENAKGGTPKSLTDVPASQTSVNDEEPTTAEGWARKFAGMTPEQILKQL
jgi:hypothetical protein